MERDNCRGMGEAKEGKEAVSGERNGSGGVGGVAVDVSV